MKNINILIPVAGKGTRTKLNYPKSLYRIGNKSILVNLISKLSFLKKNPILIVSKENKLFFDIHLNEEKIKSKFIIQKKISGMGEAIYNYAESKYFKLNHHTLLIWGDLLFIKKKNILNLIKNHIKYKNTFSLLSGFEKNPYTLILRNKKKEIKEIKEVIELEKKPRYGERDIGIFIFDNKKCKKYFLNKKNFEKGKLTKELKFLSIIKYLVKNNEKVQAYSYASSKEMLSFNSMNDIKKFSKF